MGITNKAALIKVRGYLTSYLPIDDAGEIDEIIEALEPKIYDTRWIPVSERLPEEVRTKGYGLCNVIVTHKCAGVTRTTFAVFDKGNFYTNNNFKHADNSVIAWMPLPYPYEEEKNE